jgi:hypothetical protein
MSATILARCTPLGAISDAYVDSKFPIVRGGSDVVQYFLSRASCYFIIADYLAWPLEEGGRTARSKSSNYMFRATAGLWLQHWMIQVIDATTCEHMTIEFNNQGVQMTDMETRTGVHAHDLEALPLSRTRGGQGMMLTGAQMAEVLQPWACKKYSIAGRNCQHFVHAFAKYACRCGTPMTPAQRVWYRVA